MSNEHPVSSSCPDVEELSAFVDGMSTEEGVEEHVASCDPCRAVVDSYQRADRALEACMAPPPGLSDRIVAAVAAAGREDEATVRWWSLPVMRLAAALAVTTAALGLLVAALGPGGTTTSGSALAGGPVAPEPMMPSDTGVATPTGAPDMLAKVGVQTQGRPVLASTAGTSYAAIPPRVRHVWSVSNVYDSAEYLRQVLPADSYTVGTENGNTFFMVTLPDEKIQQLVDSLAMRRWQLMNSSSPQPRQRGAYTQRDVHYCLVLAGRDD